MHEARTESAQGGEPLRVGSVRCSLAWSSSARRIADEAQEGASSLDYGTQHSLRVDVGMGSAPFRSPRSQVLSACSSPSLLARSSRPSRSA